LRKLALAHRRLTFKIFVLLRIPISGLMLLMYLNFGACGGVMFLDMLPFLVFVSIRLVQFHEDAPILASVLLMLELGGGSLMMAMRNYFGFVGYDVLNWAVMVGVVGLVWTLPNAAILYSQRAKFMEPKKEKPGG
jgi:hypothetical protein